mmetsp:Transcript_7594/g.46762  ORF Transcript_7594/g.46762 Transcript_7594/m.46762 type:complete len:196 (-) Transcript_7594:1954-2541(-)
MYTTWTFRRWIWLVLRSATTCVLPYVFPYTIYRRGRTDVMWVCVSFLQKERIGSTAAFRSSTRRGRRTWVRWFHTIGTKSKVYHRSSTDVEQKPLSLIPRGRERKQQEDRSGGMEGGEEHRAIHHIGWMDGLKSGPENQWRGSCHRCASQALLEPPHAYVRLDRMEWKVNGALPEHGQANAVPTKQEFNPMHKRT